MIRLEFDPRCHVIQSRSHAPPSTAPREITRLYLRGNGRTGAGLGGGNLAHQVGHSVLQAALGFAQRLGLRRESVGAGCGRRRCRLRLVQLGLPMRVGGNYRQIESWSTRNKHDASRA